MHFSCKQISKLSIGSVPIHSEETIYYKNWTYVWKKKHILWLSIRAESLNLSKTCRKFSKRALCFANNNCVIKINDTNFLFQNSQDYIYYS
jgi:hypothetical protein